MHHQVTQEGAEIIQIVTTQLLNCIVGGVVMVVMELFARRDFVVNRVETQAYRDDNRHNR